MKPSYRIKLGFFEILLTKRTQPIKEFQEFSEAMDNFKSAILKEFILTLNWLNKIAKRLFGHIPRHP